MCSQNFYESWPMASKDSNLHKFADWYFPDTYLVIDIETTGFNPEDNYITQFGMAFVSNRVVRDAMGFLLQIPVGSMHPKASEVSGITEEMCNTQGMPRDDAIGQIHRTCSNWRKSRPNAVFIGHNAAKFDMPFLETEFDKHNIDFRFGPDELVDTGAIVKSEQLGTYPLATESPIDFMFRVGRIRATGVYWALERYCLDRFNLRTRMEEQGLRLHDASADVVITHWVLEALRAEREEALKKHAESPGN